MDTKTILLVEDNPDDEALTLRALKRNSILNAAMVAREGAEALDRLFCRGAHAGRGPRARPDLRLSWAGGPEVPRQIRASASTQALPAAIPASSREGRDRIAGYRPGADRYIRKPADSSRFTGAARQPGPHRLAPNEPPPGREGWS